MKRKIQPKQKSIKPNPTLFKDTRVGTLSYKPLEHKDGTKFDDVDYFELLGRKAIEMDKLNKNPNIPTNYGDYDRNVVEVAKNVCKGLDDGMSKADLSEYLRACIDYTK